MKEQASTSSKTSQQDYSNNTSARMAFFDSTSDFFNAGVVQKKDSSFFTKKANNSFFRPVQNPPPISPEEKERREGEEQFKKDNIYKKENKTRLPDSLRAGMENLSGISLNDVKVHHNSHKPAQFQALAYAQGNNIHLASGQETHLPHEAWHVVQQKQGKVKPTMQMKDRVAVNDDPSLEKEADLMGAKAINLNISKSNYQEAPQKKTSSETNINSQPDVVQRRVGFEFESVGDDKWRFQGRNNDHENWTGISHTKDILLRGPNHLAGAGADNGNVEFITVPLSNWGEVSNAIQEMVDLVARLKLGDGTGKTVLNGAENNYAKNKTGFEQHQIKSNGKDILARPQATFGVSIIKIPELFKALVNMNQGKGVSGEGPSLVADRAVGSKFTIYKVEVSMKAAELIMKKACEYDDIDWNALLDLEKKEATGFLTIVFKTLFDAFSNSGSELTDPKYALSIMPRTDFISMLNTLESDTIELIRRLWNDGPLRRAINEVYILEDVVFLGGYTGNDNKRYNGPTKGEWIDSIINGRGTKDLLSPPPGFPQHSETNRPEGIGAYDADEDYLALFELRDLGSRGNLPIEQWINIATSVSKMMAVVMEDRGLAPE